MEAGSLCAAAAESTDSRDHGTRLGAPLAGPTHKAPRPAPGRASEPHVLSLGLRGNPRKNLSSEAKQGRRAHSRGLLPGASALCLPTPPAGPRGPRGRGRAPGGPLSRRLPPLVLPGDSAGPAAGLLLLLRRRDSSAAPRTGARQAPQSGGFARQEHWSGLPVPSPGDLPDAGVEPTSPAWQA